MLISQKKTLMPILTLILWLKVSQMHKIDFDYYYFYNTELKLHGSLNILNICSTYLTLIDSHRYYLYIRYVI